MNTVSTSNNSPLVEKQGTGIEKQGTGIARGLRLGIVGACCLLASVAWSAALASSFSAEIELQDSQFELSVKLSNETVTGKSVIDSGFGMVTLVNGSGTGIATNGSVDPVNGSGTGVAGSAESISEDFWGVAEVAVDQNNASVVVYQFTNGDMVEHSTYSIQLSQ